MTHSTGLTVNLYRYCGEYKDETTGLYYLRARYYNSFTGTFITADSYSGTLSDPVSLHKYLYANANPVMNSDPTGYFTLFELSAAICLDNSLEGQYNSAIVSGFSDFMEALKNGERDSLTLLQTFFNTFASEVCPGYDFYMSVCQCNTTGDYEAALEIALGTAFNASVKFSGLIDNFESNTGVLVYNANSNSFNLCSVTSNTQSRTNWGEEHGKGNIKHNNSIEDELDLAHQNGASSIRKNKAQLDAYGNNVYYTGKRYIKPDASYVLNDIRYNTNYVSNPNSTREVTREINAYLNMCKADPSAYNRLIFRY